MVVAIEVASVINLSEASGRVAACFVWDRTGRDGTGRDGTGRDGTGRDGTARHGTARDGTDYYSITLLLVL